MKGVSVIKYSLMALLAGVLMWFAFRGVDFGRLVEEISQAHLFWLGLSVIISIVAFVSRAWRWKLLIDPMGYDTSFFRATCALMTGYLANLVFPRLGEVTRCATLSRSDKIPFDQLIGTVIVERVLDVICLLVVVVFTAVVEAERLSNFIFSKIISPIWEKVAERMQSPLVWIAIAAVITGIVLFVRARHRSGAHTAFFNKVNELIIGIVKGLRSIRTLKKPWQFLFHTILIWTLYYLTAYLCFFALDATSMLTWKAALLVLVAGGLGMSVPVQGGFGAYHLLVMEGLALYGISTEHGRAFATLVHSAQVVLVILMGGISFVILMASNKNLSHEKPGAYPVENR